MSLVTPSHRHLIMRIEKMTKSKLKEGVIPTRKAIGMKKIGLLTSEFVEQKNFARALELMDPAWHAAVAGMKPEEVASRFLAMMFPWVFAEEKRPQMAPRAQQSSDSRSSGGGGGGRDGSDRRRDKPRHNRGGFKGGFKKSFHRGGGKSAGGGGGGIKPPTRHARP